MSDQSVSRIPLDCELSEKLNPDAIDPRVLPILQNIAWDEDTAYPGDGSAECPDLRQSWIDVNEAERPKPEFLQCLVTASLLNQIYEGGALLMMHVDDPEAGKVPHFIFWKDAHKYCDDVNDPQQVREAQREALDDIAANFATFEEYGFVDLTGSQFNPGSKMIIIDPTSEEYAKEWVQHIGQEPTFAEREMRLVCNFAGEVGKRHGLTMDQFIGEINGLIPAGNRSVYTFPKVVQ